jgi:hypothetical protein
MMCSIVVEPEPVERQHFAGSGVGSFFGLAPAPGYENAYKISQKGLNFSYLNFKLRLKMIFL